MHREGHYGAALVAYTPLGAAAVILGAETVTVAGAVAAVALAMVPDYDQRVPGLPHRGPTHTV
jgi:inner membrane protein